MNSADRVLNEQCREVEVSRERSIERSLKISRKHIERAPSNNRCPVGVGAMDSTYMTLGGEGSRADIAGPGLLEPAERVSGDSVVGPQVL
jgi:hypothetical protein